MTEKQFISRAEMNDLIETAVDRALQKNFKFLGLDVNNPDAIEEFRLDQQHSRKIRLASQEAATAIRQTIYKGVPAIALLIFTWMIFVFGEGLREVIADWLKPNG